MPTNRVLLTLGEVKTIIANKFKVTGKDIGTYENMELLLKDPYSGEVEIEDNSYFFQFDEY